MSEYTYRQPINTPIPEPAARQPRLRVLMDGKEIPGAERAQIEAHNWYLSSRFSVTFATSFDRAYGLAWWGRQTAPMMLDVQFSISEGRWTSMLIGEVDRISLHPNSGAAMVEGRDLSARLIETKTQETFQNRTASEIVAILAGRHGLKADTTATTTPAGAYWQGDHVAMSLDQFSRVVNEWDLLTSLARHEGFDLYVIGETLHFHPATPPDATPFEARWTPPLMAEGVSWGRLSNVTDLRMERALTLAKTVEVVVRSWNSRTGRSITRRARAIGARSADAARASTQTGTSSQRYVFVIPNLTEDQAQKEANARLADISKQERVVTFRMAGDPILDPRRIVRLVGTGTDFDQIYYVDSITSSLDFEGGYVMNVAAKNRDSRSQVVL